MDDVKFGTSGLRGLATQLTDALCANFATAHTQLSQTNGTVLIGRDLRRSSPRILQAVAAGIARAGATPVDCGVLPTPALAAAALSRSTAAIMVTGSHIPGDRNGLKFYSATGEITKDDEGPLKDAAAALPDTAPPDVAPTEDSAAREAFVARYLSAFGAGTLAGMRIGVWQHSSVARDMLMEILGGLGAETVPLGRSDSFIAVDTEAVDRDTRSRLADWAQAYRLAAVVSTDGDADRPLVADDTGAVVPGDRLGPLAALATGASTVVTTVSANTLVDRMGAFEVIRTKIGSPYVIAAMERAEGRVLGYEPNGGVLLGFDAEGPAGLLPALPTRDCLLPILTILMLAQRDKTSVRDVSAQLPARFTATDRLQGIPTATSRRLVEAVYAGDWVPIAQRRVDGIDSTDGARLTLDGGDIVHIRPSGNAPELRCYTEADTPEAAAALLNAAMERLTEAAGDPM